MFDQWEFIHSENESLSNSSHKSLNASEPLKPAVDDRASIKSLGSPTFDSGSPIRRCVSFKLSTPKSTLGNEWKGREDIQRDVTWIKQCNKNEIMERAEICMRELQAYSAFADRLSQQTSEIKQTLSSIKNTFLTSEQKLNEFSQTCDTLGTEEEAFARLAVDIDHGLSYFAPLKELTRVFRHPPSDLVSRSSFRDHVLQINKCIQFLEENMDFQESDVYLTQYKRLLTQAFTMFKNHFFRLIKVASDQIIQSAKTMQVDKQLESSLFYSRFSAIALQLRPLLREFKKSSSEDTSNLTAFYDYYLQTRMRLLQPVLSSQLRSFFLEKSITSFIQKSLALLQLTFYDESRLFTEFFDETNENFTDYWQELCETFYEGSRSMILREKNLTDLCEVCSYIRSFQSSIVEGDREDIGKELATHLSPVVSELQNRVLFLVQAAIDSEIQNYTPNDEDLFPNINKEAQLFNLENLGLNDAEEKVNVNVPERLAMAQGWYPVVQKSLITLSRIYRLLDSNVFDDIALEIIHACIGSLMEAYKYFSNKNDPQIARLFLIKNFLVLKEQLSSFEIQYAHIQAGVDFKRIWDSVREWRSNLRGIIQLVYETFPKFINNMVDTRQELNQQLRIAVNGYIESAAESITNVLKAGDPKSISEFLHQLDKVEDLHEQISSYLTEPWIEGLLLQAVFEEIARHFQEFYSTLSNEDLRTLEMNLGTDQNLSKSMEDYLNDIAMPFQRLNESKHNDRA
ncbi:transport complex subunit Cog3 [Schizosaccharomyces cryophilus OY26]|uniref:Conserved oligomeric Golgi complex subunit 3 n=1 Tax=Schizosaccharomyces cryophilus (strain OY26 / ATCC MYA-4695 / CBS 11777 / NBRC 106824 / NRRL Y48691) TaxID=653667 RepID=S9W3J3_SCHCR|nr:transport complex subunit Cog3 [Schizosaccharomyces cryophilus OY26]EPY52520.1 transport complex subunit Cog3 [Schizosaccharomyces cryophilus OY26]